VKPANVTSPVDVIKQRVASGPQQKRVIESVASILERETTGESSLPCQSGQAVVELDRRLREDVSVVAHRPSASRKKLYYVNNFHPRNSLRRIRRSVSR
jgi:hypothetical protein